MILSYHELLGSESKRKKIKAEITTEHSQSHYGQPVIVLPDGGALDLMSWVCLGYKIEKATDKERKQMNKLGLT